MKYGLNAYFDVGLLMPEVAHSLLLNKVRSCFLVFLVTSYLLLSSSYFTKTARVSLYGTHSIGIQNPYGISRDSLEFPGIAWNLSLHLNHRLNQMVILQPRSKLPIQGPKRFPGNWFSQNIRKIMFRLNLDGVTNTCGCGFSSPAICDRYMFLLQ